MKEKFTGVSLSGVMRRIFEPQVEIERLNAQKKEFEEKLNNPEKRREYLEEVIKIKEERLEEILKELETYKKRVENIVSKGDLSREKLFKKEELERNIEYTEKRIKDTKESIVEYKGYRTNEQPFIELLNKAVESLDEDIQKEYGKKEKYGSLTPDDFALLISGTNLDKDSVSEWADDEYFFRNFSQEIKEQIKKFVKELLDKGILYQPIRENLINLDSWGPYLPESGIFTPEEFKEVTERMLSNEQSIVRNLETFKKLFPEQFPADMTAMEVFEKYAYYKDDPEEDLLETFDEAYKAAYLEKAPMSTEYAHTQQGKSIEIADEATDIDPTSIEDQVLTGTTPVSFTTPTSEDKTK